MVGDDGQPQTFSSAEELGAAVAAHFGGSDSDADDSSTASGISAVGAGGQ
jgi:hypothetical protein